jgi:topoisomerase-4 subunit A
VLKLTTDPVKTVTVDYKPKPRIRILQEAFSVDDFPVRGTKTKGFRLAAREVKKGGFRRT